MNKYEAALAKFNLNLDEAQVSAKTEAIVAKIEENNTPAVRAFLYSCIDLSSLNTEDSKDSIWKWVEEKINDFDGSRATVNNVAAVCVYPNFVATVKDSLRADVRIVAVAGGFPSAQTFTEVKIAEISLAVMESADEIDVPLNCGEFLDNNLADVCDEIQELKSACREARLKVILETGLLKSAYNIKKAAILAMYSGADFIKTSTGKIYPGAKPEAVYVMCEAIREYYNMHGERIGIKIAGGVRTVEDAVKYYTIVKETLGEDWLMPDLFRIGASALADNLIKTF